MRTYVINLRRRPDRRAHIERVVQELGSALAARPARPHELFPDPPLDVVFTTDWPGPLDGQRVDRAALEGFGLFPWKIASTNSWWSRPLRKGEIGNSISHWSCWRDAAARKESHALVFEDDAVLVEGAVDRLIGGLQRLESQHTGWDFVYLGRISRPLAPALLSRDIPVAEGLVRPGYSHCAHAYILSRSGIAKVLSVGFEQALIPIDELLPALYTIHPRPDVARRYRPLLDAYAFEPPIAFHVRGTDSDTESSPFVDWQV